MPARRLGTERAELVKDMETGREMNSKTRKMAEKANVI